MLYIILFSLLTAIGRLLIPGHNLSLTGSYEAFAHIWVGFLIALTIFFWHDKKGKIAFMSLVLITILEIVMFLLR